MLLGAMLMSTGCAQALPPPGTVQDLRVGASTGRNGTTRLQGRSSRTPVVVEVSTEHRIRVREGACRGSTTAGPELVVEYDDPAEALHVVFRNRTTPVSLLVRSPDGRWHCRRMLEHYAVPWVGFSHPERGRYELWVLRDEEDNFSPGLDGAFMFASDLAKLQEALPKYSRQTNWSFYR